MIRLQQITGHAGRLRVGYHTAATLGAFRVSVGEPGTWKVTAAIVQSDPFWLAQGGPFALEIAVGAQRWSWREATVAVVDGEVIGTVTGKPERRAA